jgi:hypothetical protein
MSVRTFRQFWNALQSAAKNDPFALEVAVFVRDNVDMLEVRIGSPAPIKLLHRARRKTGFPVQILVCEDNRISRQIIGYQSLEFFHRDERHTVDGVVITDVPCERYWLGLAALKFFTANLIGQELHDCGLDSHRTKKHAMQMAQRLVYRLLDSRYKGAITAYGHKILPSHGSNLDSFGDELSDFLRKVVASRERPDRSEEEREARIGLLDDAIHGFWLSRNLVLH